MVLKGYPRLSETFIAQELLGLERLGYTLQLISLRHPTDTEIHPVHREIAAPVSYLPEYLHNEPGRVLKSVLHSVLKPGFYSAFGRFLADLVRDPTRNRVRRFGQALVMASELPASVRHLYAHFIHTPAAVTGYASMIAGLPWSCSAHAKDIWTSPDWELQQNLANTQWVATCTKTGWQHLKGLAARPENVHLIYHGLDLDRFPAPAVRADPLPDGATEATSVRLLSVGRAVDKKGFDTLLDALSLLPSEFHWHWTHIGGGGKLDKLRAQATKLGVDGRIRWLGAQSQQDVLRAYNENDLFVLPCRIAADGDRDGLPNVLVEAQSQQLACISTPISGIPELIEDGDTGVLVPPNDPQQLADAIVALGRDPARRDGLARAGAQRVRAAFDATAGFGQLAQLFPKYLAAVQEEARKEAAE